MDNLTNTFVLGSDANTKCALFELPKALTTDIVRQRRGHRKSRTGCEHCKRRRVKCNGKTPCDNCSRRGDCCEERPSRDRDGAPRLSQPVPTLSVLRSPTNRAVDSAVNLFHFKLFHHFQTSTCKSLLYPSEVWAHASQLCHDFEFLMNAMLCVAARHLAFLRPEEPEYPTAAVSHLCRALSEFRSALSNDFMRAHPDAFVATSILLQFEVWANTASLSPEDNQLEYFDPTTDRLFAFCSSLKETLLRSFPLDAVQHSVFLQHIQHASTYAPPLIPDASQSASASLQNRFSYNSPVTVDLLNLTFPITVSGGDVVSAQNQHYTVASMQDESLLNLEAYNHVLHQLCIILSFLPKFRETEPLHNESTWLPRLARHVFSFPILCRGVFVVMIMEKDSHALLLLYHLYRAVRVLLPSTEYWWASKRSIMLEAALRNWLSRASEMPPVCTTLEVVP